MIKFLNDPELLTSNAHEPLNIRDQDGTLLLSLSTRQAWTTDSLQEISELWEEVYEVKGAPVTAFLGNTHIGGTE